MLVEDVSNWRRPSTGSRMGSYENLDRVRLYPLKSGRFCASFFLGRVCIKLLIFNTSVWLWQHLLPLALSHFYSLSLNSANPPVPAPFPAPLSPPTLRRAAPNSHKLPRPQAGPGLRVPLPQVPCTLPAATAGLRFSGWKRSNGTSVCPKTFSFENKATKQAAAQKGIWGDRGRAQVSRLWHQKQQKRAGSQGNHAGSHARWHYGPAAAFAALCTFKLLLSGLNCSLTRRPVLSSDAGPHPGATQTPLSSLRLPALLWWGGTPSYICAPPRVEGRREFSTEL